MTLERALAMSLQAEEKDVRTERRISENSPCHLKTGENGENLAAEYLQSIGYSIIARNVRYRFGEIDIVAADGDEIVFAEVRTRSIGHIMPADCTVGPDKLRKLLKAANAWVENRNYSGFWRMDLVAVTIDAYGKSSVEHIREITEAIQ